MLCWTHPDNLQARRLPVRNSLLKMGIPCRYWPALNGGVLRRDAEAGVIGALLVLPQAISLAMLAGMPAEYGIYTSIIPVIVAALWGSSWHQVSGPNTAVCVLLAATVAPLAAAGGPAYIGYVLLLTLMVGVIQIGAALLRAGSLFDFVSTTIVLAIVQAVAITILVSAGGSLLGLASDNGAALWSRAVDLFARLPEARPWVATVGITTVLTGLVVKRLLPRYALVMAILAGGLSGFLLNRHLGAETTGIAVLGELRLSLLPLSIPPFERLNGQRLLDFAGAALAIAFLGAMQTIVISRSIAMRSGQKIDCNQEVVAQGLANLVAPFVSAFAGSGSFNRSAANHAAGARSPMAAVFASLLLALLVMLSGALIAQLPIAAIAGTLVLVALGLFDPSAIRRALRLPGERWIFVTSLVVALLWGLSAGLLAGLLVSLGIYLWHTSRPRLDVIH
ncbi:MAG TPA: SulP family inorganic anion transporter, partial [Chromatiaceae bacterium]|nr:SulP family inorganic anion transporter [Chromatiaceae bacterium]